jgi:hypothetical protein
VLKQHQADLASAAELGNDPAVLAQITATFHAEAQKVVDDAGLVGDGFSDFIKLFPDFAGVVGQSATAMQDANDKFAALTKTIDDYLASLQTGSNSILSPQDQLAAAQSNFNSPAGAGAVRRQRRAGLDHAIRLDAARPGQELLRVVVGLCRHLQGGDAGAVRSGWRLGGDRRWRRHHHGAARGDRHRLAVRHRAAVSLAPSAASNDNASLFANQTQSIVQAIASSIRRRSRRQKHRDGGRLDRIDQRGRKQPAGAPRPSGKAACLIAANPEGVRRHPTPGGRPRAGPRIRK